MECLIVYQLLAMKIQNLSQKVIRLMDDFRWGWLTYNGPRPHEVGQANEQSSQISKIKCNYNTTRTHSLLTGAKLAKAPILFFTVPQFEVETFKVLNQTKFVF